MTGKNMKQGLAVRILATCLCLATTSPGTTRSSQVYFTKVSRPPGFGGYFSWKNSVQTHSWTWNAAADVHPTNMLRLKGGGNKARRNSKAREAMLATFHVNDPKRGGVAKAQNTRRRASHGTRMTDEGSEEEVSAEPAEHGKKSGYADSKSSVR
jgi:hypothetical protein